MFVHKYGTHGFVIFEMKLHYKNCPLSNYTISIPAVMKALRITLPLLPTCANGSTRSHFLYDSFANLIWVSFCNAHSFTVLRPNPVLTYLYPGGRRGGGGADPLSPPQEELWSCFNACRGMKASLVAQKNILVPSASRMLQQTATDCRADCTNL